METLRNMDWKLIKNGVWLIATAIIVLGAGFTVKAHIEDIHMHLSTTQEFVLDKIVNEGFTYSEQEKVAVERRLTILESRYEEIQKLLAKIDKKL